MTLDAAPSSVSLPWPFDGRPASSPLRMVAALGAYGAAVAHIPVIEPHLYEAPFAGQLFVLLTVACLLLAHLLLVADTPVVWRATAIVSALALTGYVLSRAVGLPQMDHDVGDWGNRLGMVAIGSEALMLVCATAFLVRSVPGRNP